MVETFDKAGCPKVRSWRALRQLFNEKARGELRKVFLHVSKAIGAFWEEGKRYPVALWDVYME